MRERVGELISSWILTSNQPLMGWGVCVCVGGGGVVNFVSWILTSIRSTAQGHPRTSRERERERVTRTHVCREGTGLYTNGGWGRLDVSI